MKIKVISYSLTGNNEALAKCVAEKLGADHAVVRENKKRNMGTIVFDLLFNRTPKVLPKVEEMKENDMLLLFGPIWMGCVATPLKVYLKQIKKTGIKYAFISISGGADGPNTKLSDELIKITGKKPIAVIDLHIADLLPKNPKPTRDDTSKYRINRNDINKLSETVVQKLKHLI